MANPFFFGEIPQGYPLCSHFNLLYGEMISRAMTRGPNVFALRVEGDSMEPEFREGEIIVVNPHIAWEAGNYVIVKNHDGEATSKQIKKKEDRLLLHHLNPRYEVSSWTTASFTLWESWWRS